MTARVKVWFDPEGDFLEVQFRDAPGYKRETANDAVMESVDEQGRIVGFSILGVSRFERKGRWKPSWWLTHERVLSGPTPRNWRRSIDPYPRLGETRR